MAEVKVLYDHIGGTLCVWWDNPRDEAVCEETDHDLILIKNRAGAVIGLENIHFSAGRPEDFKVVVETAADYIPAAP